MGYFKYLRDHRIILGILGLLSISHGALFWFVGGDLFQSDFPGSEFTEEIETIVKYSMEITAGFNWILGFVLLGCTQLNPCYAKPAVIALGIGLISALPLPLRHSGGEWTDPGVIIFGLLGVWAFLGGIFLRKGFYEDHV